MQAHFGGEDAYFITDNACGVADGVGGWQDSGISAADYSRTFMALAQRYLEGDNAQAAIASEQGAWNSDDESSDGDWMRRVRQGDPMESDGGRSSSDEADAVVAPQASSSPSQGQQREQQEKSALGALAVAHKGTRMPGSSTACVLRLDSAQGRLDAANLGDSGFLVVRNGQILFESPTQQHFFDCPYQFGAVPEYTQATDSPEGDRFALQPLVMCACRSHDSPALLPKAAGQQGSRPSCPPPPTTRDTRPPALPPSRPPSLPPCRRRRFQPRPPAGRRYRAGQRWPAR